MKGNQKKIPRPLNAFMLFANDTRASFRKKYPKEKNSRISVKLGEAWKELSGQEKTRYYQLSKKAEIEHRHKYPDYSYCPNEARTKKRVRQEKRTGVLGDQSYSTLQDLRKSKSSKTIAGPERHRQASSNHGQCSRHWPAPMNSQNPWHVGQGDHLYPIQPMYGAHCAMPPQMHYHGLPYCDYRQMPMMYSPYNGMMPPYMPRPQPRMMYPNPPPYLQMGAPHPEHPETNRADIGHLPSFEAFSNPMAASADNLTIPRVGSGSVQPMHVSQELSSDAGTSAKHDSQENEFSEFTDNSKIHNMEAATSIQSHGSMFNEMTENSRTGNMDAVTAIQGDGTLKEMTGNPHVNTIEAATFIQNSQSSFNEKTAVSQGNNIEAVPTVQNHGSFNKMTRNPQDINMDNTSVQSHGSLYDDMTANSHVTSVQKESSMATFSISQPGIHEGNEKKSFTAL